MISNKLSHFDKVFWRHFFSKCAFRHSEMIDDAKIGRASSKKTPIFFKRLVCAFVFLLFFSTFSVSHTCETFENDDQRAVALQAPLPRFSLILCKF